ncbi:hypothetical protein Sps_04797 [Shewanella psychrophila]|uniref:Uncharacterized protein n=1 Tax=Shewanella psychrophila TaxID=225848 RepID=A0A1S6HWJ9_9GAMM|nr:hypothetical protein Sps_04797 [Shewanella psychrophila]
MDTELAVIDRTISPPCPTFHCEKGIEFHNVNPNEVWKGKSWAPAQKRYRGDNSKE